MSLLAEQEEDDEKDEEEDKSDGMLEREELERATALSISAAHQHTNALTAEVLMRSKEESMFASCLARTLDIVLFRLTRCARCPEVSNALRTSEILSPQRERVGGELQPGFAGGMWVFVILTHADFLVANLEPSDHAILMHPEDEDDVRHALGEIPKDRRPKLKKESWLHNSQAMASNDGDCSEFEEIIVKRTFLSIEVRRDDVDFCTVPSM